MYLPWIGYFGMMQNTDVFVFYDDVEFAHSWQRRNQIKVPEDNGGTKWLTVPVKKNQGQKINEVLINNELSWRDEHWSEIRSSYSGEPVPYGAEFAPYFDEYRDDIKTIYAKEWQRLVDLTTFTVELLADLIGVDDIEIMATSEMDISGSKTERVLEILQTIGADEYVSGPGAKDYLDVDRFEEEGIDLYWHEFQHPEYEQPYGEFVSHLSALDFLFNVGPNSRSILQEVEEGCLRKATT
jgi:hypothetical protein